MHAPSYSQDCVSECVNVWRSLAGYPSFSPLLISFLLRRSCRLRRCSKHTPQLFSLLLSCLAPRTLVVVSTLFVHNCTGLFQHTRTDPAGPACSSITNERELTSIRAGTLTTNIVVSHHQATCYALVGNYELVCLCVRVRLHTSSAHSKKNTREGWYVCSAVGLESVLVFVTQIDRTPTASG